MRKFTLLLSLLFVMVTTAMAQLENGSIYCIKNADPTHAANAIYYNGSSTTPQVGAADSDLYKFLWEYTDNGDGTASLKNIAGDLYLAAPANQTGGAYWRLLSDKQNLYIGVQQEGNNSSSTYYYISSAKIDNVATASRTAAHHPGDHLNLVTWDNTVSASQWIFEKVSAPVLTGVNVSDLQVGKPYLIMQRYSGMYMTVKTPNSNTGGNYANALTLEKLENSEYQIFYLEEGDEVDQNRGQEYLLKSKSGHYVTAHPTSWNFQTTTTSGEGFYITSVESEPSLCHIYQNHVFFNNIYQTGNIGSGTNVSAGANLWCNTASTGNDGITTQWAFIELGSETEIYVKALTDKIEEATSYKENISNVLGNNVGYYSSSTEMSVLETAIAAAQIVLDDYTNKTDAEIIGATETLQSALTTWQAGVTLNMPVEGKKYYLKHIKANKYLTIKNLSTGDAPGDVVITSNLSVSNKRQIFTFESTGTDNRFFIKTDDGYYISTNHWNFVTSTTQPTSFNNVAPDGGYTLQGIDGKVGILIYQDHGKYGDAQRVGYVSTESNANLSEDPINIFGDKVTYDASTKESALWILEEYEPLSVYMIKSAHTGYAAGSAIYYNTTAERWQWKTADRWNKEMWMVIEGHGEEAVPTVDSYDATGTHLRICDYSTSKLMRDKSVQIVKINGWDGVYNLQYSTTTNDAVQHAQEDNTDLVGWNPATTTECQASAWSIEYLGLSTDLDKLTDEQLTAMSALEAAYKVGVMFKGVVNGTGLGEFHGGDAVAMNAALTVAEEILAKSIVEIAELDAEAIANINAATATITSESAKFQINQPQAGRYYRIKGGNSGNSLPHYYITGSENSDGGRIALASEPVASTIYYLDENNHLLSYTAGLYLGVRSSNFKFEAVDTPEENIADITFEASTTKVGLYTIKSADVYLRYKIHEGNVELDKTESVSSPEDNWIIEEVESIPVNVGGIGWASLYTPAPLTIPADIEAYYISGFEGAVATLKKIETTIPANTAVILKATKEIMVRATYNFAIADDVEAITDNKLEGTVVKETKNTDAYILSAGPGGDAIGLYPLNTNTGTATGGSFINGSHKAYLPVSNAPVAGSNGFSFRFEDGMTTCIDNVNRESDNVETIYDLTGRRVEAITAPGIYIVNGNKVLVK